MTRQLQSDGASPISFGMGISRLLAFFVALSLLFGPLAMEHAMAAAPTSDHSQMATDDHCKPTDEGKADKAVSKSCCAAMCATAALVWPQAGTSEPLFVRLAAMAAPVSFPSDVLSETSTPPPRLS